MTPFYFWSCILLLSLGTFAIRMSLIGLSSRITISNRTKQVFSYIPAAILPAFIAPAAFFHQGSLEWAYGKERLLVLLISTAICFLTQSTLATVGLGLFLLYSLTQFSL